MKKIFISLLIFISSVLHLQAQNWCTPNSEWYYTRVTLQGPGYAKLTYAGTVTINSQVCQQINYYSQVFNYPSSTIYTTTFTPYRYTYEANNVVYLYNQYTTTFDTLYNFAANIGDSWLMPANYNPSFTGPQCNKVPFTVLDTGHTVIQSVNLKWLKVQGGDTIFQRIGLLNNYFYNYDNCTGTLDYTEGGTLRCFNDNQISNYKRIPQTCTFLITGISENIVSQTLSLFPNPTTNNLTLLNSDIEGSAGEIYFYNILGEEVEKISFQNKENINIEKLKKGIYFVKFISTGSKIYCGKVVKN